MLVTGKIDRAGLAALAVLLPCLFVCLQTKTQTNKQTNTKTNKQTKTQTNKQTCTNEKIRSIARDWCGALGAFAMFVCLFACMYVCLFVCLFTCFLEPKQNETNRNDPGDAGMLIMNRMMCFEKEFAGITQGTAQQYRTCIYILSSCP